MHSGNNGGMRATIIWRRRRKDAFDSRHFGCYHAHVGGSYHRILATGYITPNRVDRHVAVTEHYTRHRFYFKIFQASLLLFRKTSNLRLGKTNVIEIAFRYFRDRRFDFGIRESKRLWIPIVELSGKLANCGITAGLDVREYALNRGTNLGIGLCDFTCLNSFLYIGRHKSLVLPNTDFKFTQRDHTG
jgi:hypothetical protein